MKAERNDKETETDVAPNEMDKKNEKVEEAPKAGQTEEKKDEGFQEQKKNRGRKDQVDPVWLKV